MTRALFAYPEKAAFNRVVPKSKVYEHAKPTRALRDRFVAEVEQIKWRYKLSPETTNLPPRGGVEEIQVFQVQLKTADVSGTCTGNVSCGPNKSVKPENGGLPMASC